MITDPVKAKTALARARRTPSSKGFEAIPSSVVKKKIVVQKEILPDTVEFSAPPKDYTFLRDLKIEKPEWHGTIGIENFINCCGAGILWGFSGATSSHDTLAFVREGTRRLANRQKGLALAIVNHTQLSAWQGALEQVGYVCVSAATNPVHADGTRIYLFVKAMGNKVIEIPKSKKSAA